MTPLVLPGTSREAGSSVQIEVALLRVLENSGTASRRVTTRPANRPRLVGVCEPLRIEGSGPRNRARGRASVLVFVRVACVRAFVCAFVCARVCACVRARALAPVSACARARVGRAQVPSLSTRFTGVAALYPSVKLPLIFCLSLSRFTRPLNFR